MLDVEVVRLIQQISDKFFPLDAADINLFLAGMGLETIDHRQWAGDEYGNWLPTTEEKKQLIYEALGALDRSGLQSLASAISTMNQEGSLAEQFRVSDSDSSPLFLFASHVSREKKTVTEISQKLGFYGINLFVAHESIRPTSDFQLEIEKNLGLVHGGVIFFTMVLPQANGVTKRLDGW